VLTLFTNWLAATSAPSLVSETTRAKTGIAQSGGVDLTARFNEEALL
jgi:hypothetical protein